MKKVLLILLVLSLIISLSACSSNNVESSTSPNTNITFEWRFNPSTGKVKYGPTINGIGFGYDLF